MAAPTGKKSVLFICLGNICRSTMAEGIMQHIVSEAGQSDLWEIDSAGIGDWHTDCPPDKRTMKVLKQNGIVNYKHRGRQISSADFKKFDVIFGMDNENMSDLDDLKPKNCHAKLLMLGKYDPEGKLIIPDPYYTGDVKSFEGVYEQCNRACQGFFKVADTVISS